MAWLDQTGVSKVTLDAGVVLVTVLLMLAIAMDLKGRHFREVVRRKWVMASLLVGQIVFLPLLALAVGCTRAWAAVAWDRRQSVGVPGAMPIFRRAQR
jgi:predicted Na+-dependent transporter